MKARRILEALGRVDEKYVEEAATGRKHTGIKWGTMAACFCAVLAVSAVMLFWEKPQTPDAGSSPGDLPPHIVVNEKTYLISSHMAVSEACPAGFVYAGESEMGGMGSCAYYVSPDMPQWVYVYHDVNTDGTVDDTGTLTRTETHKAYVRYVDIEIRGKDFVCYNGQLYISLWSADPDGERADLPRAFYDQMKDAYGVRIEAAQPPDGFILAGQAAFSGYDTVPAGELSSNVPQAEVYVSSDDGNAVLVSTQWHTAGGKSAGESVHSGYDIYVLCDQPR